MINIFVTYRCQLHCDYCFARGLLDEYPDDMSWKNFQRLQGWMRGRDLPAAGFIGGEPTLHPLLPDMIKATAKAGISPVLFTNGLFSVDLARRLSRSVSNFVVNYNDPASYTTQQRERRSAVLSLLFQAGARITFSKNFAPGNLEYGYLLHGLERYNVRAVRYDLSRPDRSAANRHFAVDETRRIWGRIVSFAKECESRGISTGLDCCARLCEIPPEDLRYLQRISMKFTGICHPSVDIHPDLSASYCLPLHDLRVRDITAFSDSRQAMGHFARMAKRIRFENTDADCLVCNKFKRTCQGGCMALKRAAAPETPSYRPGQETKRVQYAHC